MPHKQPTNKKTRITIRIDDETLDWFRARAAQTAGGSYQTIINNALREYVQNSEQPLEETLRRVLREELASLGPAQLSPATFKSNTRLPR
jgi:hypothetical protein